MSFNNDENIQRGIDFEEKVYNKLESLYSNYDVFRNVNDSREKGNQIDVLLISDRNIYIIECKSTVLNSNTFLEYKFNRELKRVTKNNINYENNYKFDYCDYLEQCKKIKNNFKNKFNNYKYANKYNIYSILVLDNNVVHSRGYGEKIKNLDYFVDGIKFTFFDVIEQYHRNIGIQSIDKYIRDIESKTKKLSFIEKFIYRLCNIKYRTVKFIDNRFTE